MSVTSKWFVQIISDLKSKWSYCYELKEKKDKKRRRNDNESKQQQKKWYPVPKNQ